MSVFPRTRAYFLAGALLLSAQALSAGAPSGRTMARAVFDPTTSNVIVFGGQTAFDKGTAKAYELDETWLWNGSRWVQRYTAQTPPARATHVFVWDSNRQRAILFGGKKELVELRDTWSYQDGEWIELFPDTAPPKRQLAGAVFDPIRDRVVMFGGSSTSADGKKLDTLTDTWEFDGTNWKQIAASGPNVFKPTLVYDAARNVIVMMGVNDKTETLMYVYDGAAGTWTQKTGITLPPCANESSLVYDANLRKTLLVGGLCLTSGLTEETWAWEGEAWSKITPLIATDRGQGVALTYDARRMLPFMFGGTSSTFGEPRADSYYFATTDWVRVVDSLDPASRSRFGFVRDSVNNTIWLVGGLNEFEFFDDLWKYQFGTWTKVVATGAPTSCVAPNVALDTDRQKLVVVCSSTSTTYEFDGTAWKSFSDLKTVPIGRRFAAMAYDPTLKKTVFFGGYDTDYRNDTWTWDGTVWTEIKKNRATARGLTSMWYDPVVKKVLIYAGVGRPDPEDAIGRYEDMWSFDGAGWTKMTITATPGLRYGAQLATDPRNNKTYLFGGLRLDKVDEKTSKQVYADDTWEWDGSAWKKLTTNGVPPARENGGFEFDPSTNQLVLFAGWSGFYRSDIWTFDGTSWRVRTEPPTSRRRAGGQFARPTPPEPPQAVYKP